MFLAVLALAATAAVAVLAARRIGMILAAVAGLTTVLALIFLAAAVGPWVGVRFELMVQLALILLVLAAPLGLWCRPSLRWRPSRGTVVVAVSALSGVLVWLVTWLVAWGLPQAARLSWAMNGDTANNMSFARLIIEQNGVLFEPQRNPVPLPATLFALMMGSGGAGLQAELEAVAGGWMLLLAVAAWLAGLAVGSVVDPRRPVVAGIAAATGSLLTTLPWVAGVATEFGYANMTITLVLLLLVWLAFLGSARSPVVAGVLLCALATLVLATWSPLIVIVVTMALLLLWREQTAVRALGRGGALIVLIAVGQCMAYLLGVALPLLGAQQGYLGSGGHGLPEPWWGFGAAALGALALAWWRMPQRHPLAAGAGGLVLGAALAVGILMTLVVSQGQSWQGYYPAKMAWCLSVLLTLVVASQIFVVVAASRWSARGLHAVMAVLMLVALFAAVLVPVTNGMGQRVGWPPARIVGGHVWHTGDAAVARILELSRPEAMGLVWGSGDPDEAMINFWVIQSWGGDLMGVLPARAFAYSAHFAFRWYGTHDPSDLAPLCGVLPVLPASAVVITADPGLEQALSLHCPGVPVTVRVQR